MYNDKHTILVYAMYAVYITYQALRGHVINGVKETGLLESV